MRISASSARAVEGRVNVSKTKTSFSFTITTEFPLGTYPSGLVINWYIPSAIWTFWIATPFSAPLEIAHPKTRDTRKHNHVALSLFLVPAKRSINCSFIFSLWSLIGCVQSHPAIFLGSTAETHRSDVRIAEVWREFLMLISQSNLKNILLCQSRPKARLAARRPKLQILHDETRLLGTVYIKTRFIARNHDLYFCPTFRFQVNVGFIYAGILIA